MIELPRTDYSIIHEATRSITPEVGRHEKLLKDQMEIAKWTCP
jgi:hypothetical protein